MKKTYKLEIFFCGEDKNIIDAIRDIWHTENTINGENAYNKIQNSPNITKYSSQYTKSHIRDSKLINNINAFAKLCEKHNLVAEMHAEMSENHFRRVLITRYDAPLENNLQPIREFGKVNKSTILIPLPQNYL